MAVIELGWTAEQYWKSTWHEFHGAIQYLADKRRREAEAARAATRGQGWQASRAEPTKVKVKGRPEQVVGAGPVDYRRDGPQEQGGPPLPWSKPDFAMLRDSVIAKFGSKLTLEQVGSLGPTMKV
jgi:hypothetical protein